MLVEKFYIQEIAFGYLVKNWHIDRINFGQNNNFFLSYLLTYFFGFFLSSFLFSVSLTFLFVIQARIAQLVAHGLGIAEVPGLNPGKGENFSVTISN